MSKRLTTAEFISKAKAIHGDKYDYSLVNYTTSQSKVTIVCAEHGNFDQQPNAHLRHQGCPFCGNLSHTLKQEEFISKAKAIHGNKYDYSLANYITNTTEITILCKIHGIFKCMPRDHIRVTGRGCACCAHDARTTQQDVFIKRIVAIHGDKYDYSKTLYKNRRNKITIICKHHGEFQQTSRSHLSGTGCPSCKTSKGENDIAKWLTDANIKFIRQHKFIDCVNKQQLKFDFYCQTINTCVEYDGKQHYTPIKYFGGQKGFDLTMTRDKIKTDYCKEKGIRLIRIPYWDTDVQSTLSQELSCHLV